MINIKSIGSYYIPRVSLIASVPSALFWANRNLYSLMVICIVAAIINYISIVRDNHYL